MLTAITHTPKYLDHFLTILLETFTTRHVFARQLKQGLQPYVSTAITHTPKYLDQFLMVCLKPSQQGLFL